MFCYVWEYWVRTDCVAEFLAGYGPRGDWAELFRRDPAYLRTELLRDRLNGQRFLTVDYWESRDSCMAFREKYAGEFQALDEHFETMTERETHLGDFLALE